MAGLEITANQDISVPFAHFSMITFHSYRLDLTQYQWFGVLQSDLMRHFDDIFTFNSIDITVSQFVHVEMYMTFKMLLWATTFHEPVTPGIMHENNFLSDTTYTLF